jgi:hypothetical protein
MKIRYHFFSSWWALALSFWGIFTWDFFYLGVGSLNNFVHLISEGLGSLIFLGTL